MIKMFVLLKQRSDLTREEFIDYYENKHSVLASKLLPGLHRYVRNYLDFSISPQQAEEFRSPDSAPAPYFDTITEVWFQDQDQLDSFMAVLQDPEVSRQLAEDEANFLDRKVMQTFMAQEFEHIDRGVATPIA